MNLIEIFQWCLLIILIFIGGYFFIRLLTKAFFKSKKEYIDDLKSFEKENDNG